MDIIKALLAIFAEVLPMIHPDEAAKIQKKIDALEEKYAKDKEALKKAVVAGDVPAINAILGSLLDL